MTCENNCPDCAYKTSATDNTAARYEPTALEKVTSMWWVFWYTARPIVLGAIGSLLPTMAVYLAVGWNVVDEMESRGLEFTSTEAYVYGMVSWPRSLAYITAGTDDMIKTLKDMQDILDEINSGRWERKPASQDSTRPAARPKGGL